MTREKEQDSEGFLERWSRRKRGEEPDPAPPAAPESAEAARAPEPEPAPEAAETDDAAVLSKLGLRDPDEMAPGDDFSGFMRSDVPARLRNRALRKLWLSNPALANLDELLDYGEDFTDAATVVENLQTAYQVGRGILLPEEEEKEAEAAASEAAEEPGAPAEETGAAAEDEEAAPSAVLEKVDAAPEDPVGGGVAALTPEPAPEPRAPSRPSRMRFEFE